MRDSIVLSCRRSIGEVDREAAAAHLERARHLAADAEGLGATLVAWGATAMTFAFAKDAIDDAITLAIGLLADAPAHREAWACGIAHGEIEMLEPSGARGTLAWGTSLVAAEALASIARPGEIVVARDLPALRSRLLTPTGRRTGYDQDRRVRGVAIDAQQPWRSESEALVERLVEPAMFGRERIAAFLSAPGTLGVVNAEPGLGGSRFLAELAAAVAPSPTLIVAPVGAGMEPLGSLRHAFARFMITHPERIGAELLPILDRLLTGSGIDAQSGCALLLTALGKPKGGRPGALLLDDAHEIDEETVDICARAAKAAGDTLHIAVRSDGTWELPPVLTRLTRGAEITLSPFGPRDGEAYAAACLGQRLAEAAQVRWSRRGGFTPLGISEALTAGFVTGDLAWEGDCAVPRRRFSGKGRPRDATEWIRDRAVFLDEPSRMLVSALALLGGRASVDTLADLLRALGADVEIRAVLRNLVAKRWLTKTDDTTLALPCRTHARALLSLLDQDTAERWHTAAADVLSRDSSLLVLGDAAHHASKARDVARAAELGRAAADIAQAARLDDGSARLLAFADHVAPGRVSDAPAYSTMPVESIRGEDDATTHELRLSAAFRAIGSAPLVADASPTSARSIELLPMSDAVPVIGEVEDEVAEDTLSMKVDPTLAPQIAEVRANAASGPAESTRDIATRAFSAATLGKIPEILRLRAAKSGAENGSLAARCQASLALGVTLESVGRVEEALLEGLDALARAREEDENERGLEACLAFLAKLFARVSRGDEARRLGMAARRPVDERLRPPY